MSDTNEKFPGAEQAEPATPKKKRKRMPVAARVALSAVKWTFLLGVVGAVTAGAAVTGYVSALVRDDEVRSRETILEEMQHNSETGFVYFRDGTIIGQLRTEEDRRLIEYEDIPQIVEDAVLATEDEDFYNHIGVDFMSLARAVKEKVLNEEVQTGGSTITQQVARRVFLNLDRTDSRKFKEIFLALRLERFMTKEDILAAYLNKIPFGNGASGYQVYGIKAAATGIFDKDLDDLNIAQAAYLAGLPQSPSTYSAFTGKGEFDEEGFKEARERQELVLHHMKRTGKITDAQYEEALAFDIKASLAKPKKKAYSTYPYLMLEAERQAAETLLRQSNPELGPEDMRKPEYQEALKDAREMLLRGGYKIYTTIDKTVYEAMHRVSENPEMFTKDHEKKGVEQVGGILLDNDTGAILGMIEGRDFYLEQLNHATQMQRQPGSAMKPIAAYLPAIESGAIQPASIIDDVPLILPDGQKGVHIPKNHDGRYHGLLTAREALNQSWNIPAIKLFLYDVTIDKAWEFAKKLGISSLTESDYHASTGVIGGLQYGVSVEELTNAYSTIANKGLYADAYFVEKITDSADNVVYKHEPKPERVFSEQTAYLMTDMMRTVITNGTASRVKSRFEHEDKVPIVGKTGTTSDNYDLWFVGYSPDVTLGIWIGYDQPSTLTEANRAKYVWADVMNELVASKSDLFQTEAFEKPEGIVSKTVSRVSGLLPSELVTQEKLTVTDIFNREYIPTKQDDVLGLADVVLVDGKAYTPQPGTPADMVKKMRVVRREEPIGDLLKRIEEALAKLPEKSRRPIESYRPTDGYGDAPSEVDPRSENGLPPAAPPWVKLTKTDKGAQVQFGASYNGDVAGYRVFRSVDGGPFQPLPEKTIRTGETLSFVDQTSADRIYGYYIVSVDIAGRVSEPSEVVYTGDPFPLSLGEGDGAPLEPLPGDEAADAPKAPGKPSAKTRDLGVRLEWTPSAAADQVDEYRIYYAPEEGGPYNQIGVSGSAEFEFLSLTTAGWYRVTAANSAGESPPSAAVQFKP
ncbi:carboxypeptidase [Paenibacillus antri]|uniref:Carboxypeptidase n=1 Tax=Paenibacillus antri TaxID=2582848 RepID=A0A5R9G987_9BACL|nr:transglycosylase domain-containing protein [Paenibacillus antri]TLS49948.1 carboxypeptidase [Paenibacillus antri]